MINLPPPTRVAIGAVQVAGKTVEIYLTPEWSRYFQSLNTETNSTAQNLQNCSTGAFMGLLADGGDGDSVTGPPGKDGEPGSPGPALYMLGEDSGDGNAIPVVQDISMKADLGGAAFTGPISVIGGFPASYSVSAKSTGTAVPATIAATNSDNSYFLVNYSGSTTDTSPAIWWKTGSTLRFAVATNGTTAAGFAQLATLAAAGLAVTAGFGCNGKLPQPSAAAAPVATDLATVIALCNQLRAALIANGIAA